MDNLGKLMATHPLDIAVKRILAMERHVVQRMNRHQCHNMDNLGKLLATHLLDIYTRWTQKKRIQLIFFLSWFCSCSLWYVNRGFYFMSRLLVTTWSVNVIGRIVVQSWCIIAWIPLTVGWSWLVSIWMSSVPYWGTGVSWSSCNWCSSVQQWIIANWETFFYLENIFETNVNSEQHFSSNCAAINSKTIVFQNELIPFLKKHVIQLDFFFKWLKFRINKKIHSITVIFCKYFR